MGSQFSLLGGPERRSYSVPGANRDALEPLMVDQSLSVESGRIADAFRYVPKTEEKQKPVSSAVEAPGGDPRLNPASEPHCVKLCKPETSYQLESHERSGNGVDDDSSVAEPGYFVHALVPEDTLAGLSLKYGVSTDDIRKANFMTDDRLVSYVQLMIPAPKQGGFPLKPKPSVESKKLNEQRRERSVQLFASIMSGDLGTRAGEYYLSRNDYSLRKALEEAERDTEWEKTVVHQMESDNRLSWRNS